LAPAPYRTGGLSGADTRISLDRPRSANSACDVQRKTNLAPNLASRNRSLGDGAEEARPLFPSRVPPNAGLKRIGWLDPTRGLVLSRYSSTRGAVVPTVRSYLRIGSPVNGVKSKQRVADHGEVFTPAWMVEIMLDLVKGETERIDSRFLEPACGSGNFVVQILRRKLAAVELKYGKSDFERRHYALLGLMCLYGIELLPDNIVECRANLLEIFADYLKLGPSDELYRAAFYVLSQNLIHGDALMMRAHDAMPISFAEWGYLGKGRFQRRDFRLERLTESSAFSAEGSLFAHLGKHEIFTPTKTYAPMTVRELAAIAPPDVV
jgi:hypothetical protein